MEEGGFINSPFLLNQYNMDDIAQFLALDSQNILSMPFKLEGKDWDIKPLTVRQVIEISPYASQLALDDFKSIMEEAGINILPDGTIENATWKKALDFIAKYGNLVAKILEIAVRKDISDEITPDEMALCLSAVLYRMGEMGFLKSINLCQGLSLSTKAGLIAAQKKLTEYSTQQG